MPTPSKRTLAIQAMVTLLQTIVTGATYYRTLLPANVTTSPKLFEANTEGNSFIWVHSGSELITPHFEISSSNQFEGSFTIFLDCTVKDATGETMVFELEDLLHDISLCLGDNRNLSGVVADSVISRIDPPVYGIEETYAATTVHVVCTYDFDYGQSI